MLLTIVGSLPPRSIYFFNNSVPVAHGDSRFQVRPWFGAPSIVLSPSPNANQLARTFSARASRSTVSTAGSCRPFSMSPMVE